MIKLIQHPFLARSRTMAGLVAVAAGALNVFAFAPFGLWPLQILTLALTFRLLLGETEFRRGLFIGTAYSFGWLAAGVHWLYISMHDYGGLPGWMAASAVALLALALGSWAGLCTGAAVWLRQRRALSQPVAALLLLPAMWTLAEWLRGWLLTGFPWVGAGYAHTAAPLAGYGPLIGVYGIALIAAVIAGCLALRPSLKSLGFAASLLAVGATLKPVQWTTPVNGPISVRLLQANVAQEMKFAPEQLQATLALYYDLITAAPADLIATPETAIPLLSTQLPPDYLGLLSDFARKSESHIALGLPVSDAPHRYANSIVGLSPAPGTRPYRYDKHHLVPFGEFIPYGARWFVDMMRIPLGDFDRGDTLQAPFAVRGQWVLPNICYEDLFGEEIAAQIAAGNRDGMPQATILLNESNIAWFGDSIALPQHLQISQMRAIETGRPMLRATNTGATAVIDAKGQVVAQLAPFTRGVLSAPVQGYGELTPYVRYGNVTVVALLLIMLGAAWLSARRRPQKLLETR